VKHAGESFLLTRSDKPLARLVPVRPGVRAKGAEIMHSLAHLPLDPDFADDLERVNSMDRAIGFGVLVGPSDEVHFRQVPGLDVRVLN
jgi:antitoxin (DNA-binding transcriptional repressor) of toxin-antitoxin stability system